MDTSFFDVYKVLVGDVKARPGSLRKLPKAAARAFDGANLGSLRFGVMRCFIGNPWMIKWCI